MPIKLIQIQTKYECILVKVGKDYSCMLITLGTIEKCPPIIFKNLIFTLVSHVTI